MDSYHFFADVMTTWRSMNDGVKVVGIISFSLMMTAITAIIVVLPLWFRHRWRRYQHDNSQTSDKEKGRGSDEIQHA